MAMSGVRLDEACKVKYDEVQKKHMHRYVTFHIKDDKEIVVDKVGERSATFNDFVDAVKQKDGNSEDCRYAILDYEFTLEAQGTEASQRDAILLFMYCPETARIKKKMIYSSSFDTVKRAFNGIKKAININDESDLNEEFVKEKAMEGLRV
jgi:cofilin